MKQSVDKKSSEDLRKSKATKSMVEAVSKGFFANNYTLQINGQEVALLDISGWRWRPRAKLSIAERTYKLHRKGLFRGRYLLEINQMIVAEAVAIMPRLFRKQFEMTYGRIEYSIEGPYRNFVVRQRDHQVGSVTFVEGIFRRRALIDLPEEWPLSVCAFVFWLAWIISIWEEKA